MIIFDNIQINYNDFTAVDDFNLKIAEGEIISLFGPSGCGKSTIVKAILDLIPIAKGKILIEGSSSIFNPFPVAYAAQENELFPWMTVLDNVNLWHFKSIKSFNSFTSISPVNALSMLGLSEAYFKWPKELSGGMARRTVLARSLATQSKVLILDEPFVGIEYKLKRKIMELIRIHVKEHKITCLFISHDFEETIFLSDRIIVLAPSQGQIKKEVTVNLPNNRTSKITDSVEFKKYALEIL